VADTTDPDPLGTESYRRLLRLLANLGPAAFIEAIQADDWEFAHDQWGVHVWAKLFAKFPPEHVYYFSPQTAREDYAILPNVDPLPLLSETDGLAPGEKVARFVAAAVAQACAASEAATGQKATVAYLADGPHGIPVCSPATRSTSNSSDPTGCGH
jgi:lactate racemase